MEFLNPTNGYSSETPSSNKKLVGEGGIFSNMQQSFNEKYNETKEIYNNTSNSELFGDINPLNAIKSIPSVINKASAGTIDPSLITSNIGSTIKNPQNIFRNFSNLIK